MAKINTQNEFELLATNRSLRSINDNLMQENTILRNKTKDLIEINSLLKDANNRLEITLHGLLCE